MERGSGSSVPSGRGENGDATRLGAARRPSVRTVTNAGTRWRKGLFGAFRGQDPDVASTVAGDIAEVAADIGLFAEALQAVGHVLDDRELRFARVAGRIAATAGGRRLPPDYRCRGKHPEWGLR